MKVMNVAEMHSVNAGGTSYITKTCKYKKKGCNHKTKVGYNNAWYCKWWTKPTAEWQANSQINLHQGRYCIYRYY